MTACTRAGCAGTIADDGFCDDCGRAAPAPAQAPAPAAGPPTAAAPARSTPTGPSTTGSSSTGSGRTSRSGRSRSTSSRRHIGAGLVEIVATRAREVDPAGVVLADPQVPERHRFCGHCDAEVGRARDGRPGRAQGFCPNCGTPFSFVPALVPGDVIADQYEIVGCLAHGGLGWIHLALDRAVDDRWVVLKGLIDTGDEAARQRWNAGEIDGVPRDGGGTVALRIAELRKPIIAAFNGPAVGVGVTMTLPMDIRIAAESARFGLVFTRRGLLPEAASTWFLPRVVGISQAMEWVSTGRIFDAQEALRGRLVSRVVPDSELLPTARAIAAEIAENTSSVSVAVARQLMWNMLGADDPWEAHRLDSKGINVLGAAPDAAEGVRSFLEKRAPEYPMKLSEDYPDFVPPWPKRPEAD